MDQEKQNGDFEKRKPFRNLFVPFQKKIDFKTHFFIILFLHEELEHRLELLFRIIRCCVLFHSLEVLQEFWRCKFLLCFFVVVKNLLQRVRDSLDRVGVVREWNDEGEGFNDGKRGEEFVGRRIVEKNVVDGTCDPKRVT